MPFISLPASTSARGLDAASSASTAFWRRLSLHFATKHSLRLVPVRQCLRLYGAPCFVVWLQYAVPGPALFAEVRPPIVLGGTLFLTWIAVLPCIVSHSRRLIAVAPPWQYQCRDPLARRARATKI